MQKKRMKDRHLTDDAAQYVLDHRDRLIENFDPKNPQRFITQSNTILQSMIIDFLRTHGPFSRAEVENWDIYQGVYEELQIKLQHRPTEQEIGDALLDKKYGIEKIQNILHQGTEYPNESLQLPNLKSGGPVAPESSDPAKTLEIQHDGAYFFNLADEKARELLDSYFVDGKTLKEIGDNLPRGSRTEGAISLRLKAALGKLRSKISPKDRPTGNIDQRGSK